MIKTFMKKRNSFSVGDVNPNGAEAVIAVKVAIFGGVILVDIFTNCLRLNPSYWAAASTIPSM